MFAEVEKRWLQKINSWKQTQGHKHTKNPISDSPSFKLNVTEAEMQKRKRDQRYYTFFFDIAFKRKLGRGIERPYLQSARRLQTS